MYNQVALLQGLPFLEELPRGDFLCDALEWLDETDPDRCARFRDAFANILFSLNVKASAGHLRVLGKRRLFLSPFRTAPTSFDCVPQHKKDALHVSVR